jgi:hypothetical protein
LPLDVIVPQLLVQHLDNHLALEQRLFTAIHGTAAALSDRLEKKVLPQRAPTEVREIAICHRLLRAADYLTALASGAKLCNQILPHGIPPRL